MKEKFSTAFNIGLTLIILIMIIERTINDGWSDSMGIYIGLFGMLAFVLYLIYYHNKKK